MVSKYEYSYKLILLGETAVGKTTFAKQYIDQKFNNIYNPTIGIEYGYKFIEIENEGEKIPIKLHIWDTAGQELYRSITRSYYRDSAGVLLLYDITDEQSFIDIKRWYGDILKYLDPLTPIILIGNKVDMKDKREVSEEKGKEWASSRNILFMEASGKEYELVEEAFIELCKSINKRVRESIMYGINLPSGVRLFNQTIKNTFEFEPKKETCC